MQALGVARTKDEVPPAQKGGQGVNGHSSELSDNRPAAPRPQRHDGSPQPYEVLGRGHALKASRNGNNHKPAKRAK